MSCSVSLMLVLTWDINISFEELTPQIGGWIWKKNPLYAMPKGLGISWKAYLLFSYCQWWLVLWCVNYIALSDLPSYGSDSWRHSLRYLLLCQGWGGELLLSGKGSKWIAWPRRLSCGSGGRKKLCMLPCRSCHIYRIWRSKKVGKILKSSYSMQGGGQAAKGKGAFF